MHYQPCLLYTSLIQICEEYHIEVVEDAAESIGSLYKGKHTGTFGKVDVYKRQLEKYREVERKL